MYIIQHNLAKLEYDVDFCDRCKHGCVHFAGDPRLRDVSETPSPDFLSQTSTSTYIFSCQDAEIYQFHIFEKLHRCSVKVYSIMFKNI